MLNANVLLLIHLLQSPASRLIGWRLSDDDLLSVLELEQAGFVTRVPHAGNAVCPQCFSPASLVSSVSGMSLANVAIGMVPTDYIDATSATADSAPLNKLGGDRLMIHCGECGLLEVANERGFGWELVAHRFVAQLAHLLKLAGQVTELEAQTWHLGYRITRKDRHHCWFLTGRPGALLERMEQRKGQHLLLTINQLWLRERAWPTSVAAINIADHLHLVNNQLTLADATNNPLADWLEQLMPRVSSRKSPAKRGSRLANIEVLEQELVEYLRGRCSAERSADDHQTKQSKSTSGRSSSSAPLSQKDLAKLTALSPVSVNRCLNDPAAQKLQLLWKYATGEVPIDDGVFWHLLRGR